MATDLRVLFRVAAGPRMGFGHLARSRSLARALGVPPIVSVRGGVRTKTTAGSLGWTIVHSTSDSALRELNLDLVVVDDPSRQEGQRFVLKARRLGIRVASIHDLGIAPTTADLLIDGSIHPVADTRALRGPEFAILDPSIAQLRAQRPAVVPQRVVIALGGGRHVYSLASHLTRAIARECPSVDIHVACGFAAPAKLPALARGHWFGAPDGLGRELAQAAVAIVAGGITLYEAAALGVPSVGVAVTAAQYTTVRAFAYRGALLDGGRRADGQAIGRIASCVSALMTNDPLRSRLSREASRIVDGLGAARVAHRLRQLAAGEAVDAA